MHHRLFFRYLLSLEAFFVALTVVVVWLNEFLDLPHLFFGAPATPVNYTESLFESALLLAGGSVMMWLTVVLMKRIRYLEGILAICSFCKKVRVGDHWEAVEAVVAPQTDANFSHTVCPDCAEEHYGSLLKNRKK